MNTEEAVCAAVGWIIPKAKYDKMMAAAGDRRTEVEDEFHYINGYEIESSVFLGKFVGVKAGDYIDMDNLHHYIDTDYFSREMVRILKICGEKVAPDTEWFNTHIYLMNRLL